MPYIEPKYYIGIYNFYIRVPFWVYLWAQSSSWISTKFTRYAPQKEL